MVNCGQFHLGFGRNHLQNVKIDTLHQVAHGKHNDIRMLELFSKFLMQDFLSVKDSKRQIHGSYSMQWLYNPMFMSDLTRQILNEHENVQA